MLFAGGKWHIVSLALIAFKTSLHWTAHLSSVKDLVHESNSTEYAFNLKT